MSDEESENGDRRGDAGPLEGASLENARTGGKQPASTSERSAFGGGAFEGSAFEGSAFEGSAFEHSAFDGSAFERGAFDGGAFEHSAFDGGAFEHSAFEGSAFEGSKCGSPCEPATGSAASNDNGVPRSREAGIEAFWRAYGMADASGASPPAPSLVIVDADPRVRATLLRHLGQACAAHDVAPAGAVALLRRLASVDIALVDCDPPPSQQAPIFRALARWPGTVCVLMSHDQRKVEQLRALGLFAPLVLDKPLQPTALAAIRAAVLEIAASGV